MIHFTCDGCGRPIDEQQTRYVVRLEVYAAIDDDTHAGNDEDDHLEEIEDLLERIDEEDGVPVADDRLYQQRRYDLCAQCRERLLRNPLGRGVARTGFSNN
ncbi:MAG: hypothetical protein AAF805_02855 [Planctomycetota bacterium]